MSCFFLITALSITVYLGSHAYLHHLEHAEQARSCIQQNGVWKTYRNPMVKPSIGFAGIP
jgi:hypothetical protein